MRVLAVLALLVTLVACIEVVPPQNTGANECITSAGYTWCAREQRCVRPWELARLRSFGNTQDEFENYCSSLGGSKDENGCDRSAGYSWCQAENACVRPWELAQLKSLDGSKLSFEQYCNNQNSQQRQLAADTDENGCLISAGYTWCQAENACVRPWELARQKNLDATKSTFNDYCAGQIQVPSTIGGTKDEHGCISSAGYMWCEAEGACIRPWELARSKNLVRLNVAAYCSGLMPARPQVGGEQDEHGCLASAGYSWCEAEGKCVRPWELARQKNLDATKSTFDAYCGGQTPKPAVGSDLDEHGCIASAGYTWCAVENRCVRPWEVSRAQNLDGTRLSFAQYCSGAMAPPTTTPIGGTQDEHGCLASAGYSWCEAEGKCVRPWELANLRGLDGSPASFTAYCSGASSQPLIGSDADDHGCVASAGYRWCAAENKCVRPWELVRQRKLESSQDAFEAYCAGTAPGKKIGSDRDEHGCIGSAGYKWCAAEQRCVRVWELAREKGMQLADVQAYCA